MAANPDTYKDLVTRQRSRNPCVANLDDFLSRDHGNRECRIQALDFIRGETAQPREVQGLFAELTKTRSCQFMGQLLMIEDLTSSVIEALGSTLNIDPLFFASHLDTPSMKIDSLAPNKATLPSRLRSKDYVNIHYHRTIKFQAQRAPPPKHLNLQREDIYIHRKVTVLMPIKDVQIGLAQHCVSIYRTIRPAGDWLGNH